MRTKAPERRRIKLREYWPERLGHNELREDQGERVYRAYRDQIDIDFPSPKTDRNWELTSKGWVGFIPLDDEVAFELVPKVSIGNLFRMLEYAYDLRSFKFLPDLTDCDSLREFYERLANILAQQVVDRERKGLHRDYMARQERLPYLRGRWDLQSGLRRFWEPTLACNYEENTADIEDNTILAWTLFTIAQSGLCTERVLPRVRRAYRALRPVTTLAPTMPRVCAGRTYTRLNGDYESMHALCRFFLEQTGPSHERGQRVTLPFLVNMNALFERFVAKWLAAHLRNEFRLHDQETLAIDEGGHVSFRIDLDVRDKQTNVSLFVMDTKYKVAEHADAADVQQVIAYGEAKRCTDAVLIYPKSLEYPIDKQVGRIRVRSLAFDISGDLEEAGHRLLDTLGVSGGLR